MPQRFWNILLFLSLFVASPALIAGAQNGIFDGNTTYDVYFSSSDHDVIVAESVKVLRFEEIAGRTFVVIQSSGFNLKDQEGYVLFDAISAILPDKNFRLRNKKGLALH